jgi:hypothetical protein
MAIRTGNPPRTEARPAAHVVLALLAAALPLIGLMSLLLRSELDPHFENYRAHFVVFGIVGGVAFILGYTAGEAANRRGDARVLLLSLAFMATGGFLGLHAIGTAGVRRPPGDRRRVDSPPDAPASSGPRCDGSVVRLDGCRAAAVGGVRQ